MNVWLKIAARVTVALLWEARLIDPTTRERPERDDWARDPGGRRDRASATRA